MGVFPCFLALMGPDAARGIMRNREPTINENLDFLFSRCFFRENFSLWTNPGSTVPELELPIACEMPNQDSAQSLRLRSPVCDHWP